MHIACKHIRSKPVVPIPIPIPIYLVTVTHTAGPAASA